MKVLGNYTLHNTYLNKTVSSRLIGEANATCYNRGSDNPHISCADLFIYIFVQANVISLYICMKECYI